MRILWCNGATLAQGISYTTLLQGNIQAAALAVACYCVTADQRFCSSKKEEKK